jgi:hypothetical protein
MYTANRRDKGQLSGPKENPAGTRENTHRKPLVPKQKKARNNWKPTAKKHLKNWGEQQM